MVLPLATLDAFSPITPVVPFTSRDTATNLTILYALEKRLNDLIVNINDVSATDTDNLNLAIEGLTASLNATLVSALNEINASTATLVTMETTLTTLQATLTAQEADYTSLLANITALHDSVVTDIAAITATVGTKVSKGSIVVNPRDFGAVMDGVADDTAAFQAAIDSLPGNASLGGGTVLIDGPASIGSLVINKSGVRFQGIGGYSAFLTPIAGLTTPMFTFAVDGSVVRGWQMENIAIDMLNRNAHAIIVKGAFDNCRFSDVWVRGLHPSKSGFQFMPSVGTEGDPGLAISQSIIADNCQAIRTTGALGATAPLWSLNYVHEAHFRNCKAIGGGPTDGGFGFDMDMVQLVKFDTCSASNVGTGFRVRSTLNNGDYSERVIIDSPLFETCQLGLKVLGTAVAKVYGVVLRTPRVSNALGGGFEMADIEYGVRTHIDGESATVRIKPGSSLARVFTDDLTTVIDTSTEASNAIFGFPNNVDQTYSINERFEVDTNGVGIPARAVAMHVGVNYLYGGAVATSMQRVSIGAYDSGGAGYSILRVPNELP